MRHRRSAGDVTTAVPGCGGGFASSAASDQHYVEEIRCENCGAPKQGLYCAVCGQNDRNYRRSVFPVVGQALAETFETDSRLWATLRALLVRPGHLSREFSRNRRASYLPPFRLYLFSSIVFFFALSMTIDLPEGPGEARAFFADREDAPPVLRERLREGGIELRRTDGGTEEEGDGGGPGLTIQFDLDDDDIGLALEGGQGSRYTPTPDQRVLMERFVEVLDDERRRRLERALRGPLGKTMWESVENLTEQSIAEMDRVDLYVVGQVIDFLYEPWAAARTWIENLPVAMFCVLPLYALLLKIVYPSRYYAEHIVFAMHIHTVAFIVFTVMMILPETANVDDWASLALFIGFAAYQFLALRNYYGGGVLATTVKYCLLGAAYSVLLFAAFLAAFGVVFLLM
ncbi:MAG: DUF3667 domain-containing protein [Gammaproteobacteria bacterium]|nr:DUF3667 domain-containing protein [Gammaproteobacteria bacterium]